MKSFFQRIITAIIMVAFVFMAVRFLPGIYFSALLFLIICVAVLEFVKLCQPTIFSYSIVIVNGLIIALSFTFGVPELSLTLIIILVTTGAFFLFSIKTKEYLSTLIRDLGIQFLIFFYLFFPLYFLFEIKSLGPNYLFIFILVVAICDSAAYVIGSIIGRHKIYPVASPNKTLEGLIGAVLFASLAGWFGPILFPLPVPIPFLTALISGAIIGLISQISDPIESLFKRAAGKKDSGSVLPGHGGLLDRLDSYIFCAPVLFFIIKYFWV